MGPKSAGDAGIVVYHAGMASWVPLPETVFEGKYLIEEQIGEGGFAAVFRAREVRTNRVVAIKVLAQGEEHWQMGERLAQRFEREAQLLAQLNNEHTVRLLEYARSREGALYLVFEYVDGIDLAELLEQHGPLEPRRVVQILQQVCSALGEAHQLGILHRDIKPANIMVYAHMTVRDLVKLLDFGIAKPMGEGESELKPGGLTTAGIVLGTPRYMSPEQISGAQLAATSDIYSLGLVAYELLVGVAPIGSETRTGIVREQLAPTPFAWPKSPSVPRSLRRIIDKMLSKNRRERYQICDEVLVDLAAWRDEPRFRMPPKVLAGAAVGAVALIALVVAVAGADDPAAAPRQAAPPVVAPAEAASRPEPPVAAKPAVKQAPPAEHSLPEHLESGEEGADEPSVPTRPRPPEDDIEPLQLRSAAQAKTYATTAYTMGNWKRVVASCKRFAERSSFCARMLGEAYKNLGDVDRACYWFEAVEEKGHGLECPEFDGQ